jgi:uncharacterized protein YceK
MTVVSKANDDWGVPLSGFRCSLESIQRNEGWFVPLILLDMPLSLAADTILLPVDVPVAIATDNNFQYAHCLILHDL